MEGVAYIPPDQSAATKYWQRGEGQDAIDAGRSARCEEKGGMHGFRKLCLRRERVRNHGQGQSLPWVEKSLRFTTGKFVYSHTAGGKHDAMGALRSSGDYCAIKEKQDRQEKRNRK